MKKLPKQLETKKLHYGEYLYKLVLSNSLSNIFKTEFQKEGDLRYAKAELDKLEEQYRSRNTLYISRYRSQKEIPVDQYLDAKYIYKALKESKNYKVRASYWGQSLVLYSNDRNMLKDICDHMYVSAKEFWEPSTDTIDLLNTQQDIIVVDSPPSLPIKINFKNGKINTEFAVWLESNSDKCRVGHKTLKYIRNGYVYGSYIFVRDEKVLNLVTLLVGGHIRSIHKLVYREDIDKY